MTPKELRAAIDAAVRDYRLTYPEPWPLAPNLRLLVAARAEMDRLSGVCESWGQNYDSWVAATREAEEKQRQAEDRLNALIAVHARYFDMDAPPENWGGGPEPEDVWRYDRDFRAALLEEGACSYTFAHTRHWCGNQSCRDS